MHPAVSIIKDEIHRAQISYAEIAHRTGISINRLRNMMTGRTPVTLDARDSICSAIGVSPVNIVIRREDLTENGDYLDLSWMPDNMKKPFSSFYRELKFSLPKKFD
ncbi:XRE family transcriptional regulator (plasmid) [Pantoea agglomerans]|uniref:helix-turn-helix domain-containing protein n=1 Tax=Enterobacter agglomerans TaxID=549 RepID=UPI000F5FA039|nr:helix-turn-helix transcriptional regulator [Pantoea agglomerans]AZI53413.1 XRE family transcriptional regulator [Pantoea agglomerans]